MKAVALTVVALTLGVSVLADSLPRPTGSCYEWIMKDAPRDARLTVTMRDSSSVQGVHPMFDLSSKVMRLQPASVTGAAPSVVLPLDSISRITYRKPSEARKEITIMGVVIGAVGGAIIGASAAPENRDLLNMEPVQYGFSGAVIGGLFGGIIGSAVGSGLTTEVSVSCK